MAKKFKLNVGDYKLDLTINRRILLEVTDKYPNLLNQDNKMNTISSLKEAFEVNVYLLYCMAKESDPSFTLEKANEIYDYAEDCIVDINGEEMVAQDYLNQKIGEMVNEGFTKSDNAKKIKITLS